MDEITPRPSLRKFTPRQSSSKFTSPGSWILQVCVVGEGGGAVFLTGFKSRRDRQKGQRECKSRKDGRREDYPQSGFADPSSLCRWRGRRSGAFYRAEIQKGSPERTAKKNFQKGRQKGRLSPIRVRGSIKFAVSIIEIHASLHDAVSQLSCWL